MKQDEYSWVAVDRDGRERLDVKARDWSEDERFGYKVVLLTQTAGSMHFQFSMTPEQARQMAMALIAAAESLA